MAQILVAVPPTLAKHWSELARYGIFYELQRRRVHVKLAQVNAIRTPIQPSTIPSPQTKRISLGCYIQAMLTKACPYLTTRRANIQTRAEISVPSWNFSRPCILLEGFRDWPWGIEQTLDDINDIPGRKFSRNVVAPCGANQGLDSFCLSIPSCTCSLKVSTQSGEDIFAFRPHH